MATLFSAADVQGAAASSPPRQSGVDFRDISVLTIRAKHAGWAFTETNLTLIRSNGLFVGGGHSVPESAVSELLAAMQRGPLDKIDPGNLGLTPEWVADNRIKLLTAFGGKEKNAIFPRASGRQRAWLTNALLDLNLLGEVVRSSINSRRTDDYPEIHLGFGRGDMEVARVESWAQHTFMVPWTVVWGTNKHTSYDADISCAVTALLPAGFLHRERIQGNLFSIITHGFEDHPKVRQQIEQMVLEETLRAETNRFFREFEVIRSAIQGGSYDSFPETWWANLHRTNWPPRLQMPVPAPIEQGVVPLLRRLLDTADARVQPILECPWLVGFIQGEGKTTIEVAPEGSPTDDGIMRGHMAKVGLAGFYDEHQALLRQGLFLTFRENTGRKEGTSGWFVLPGGNLLLVKFTGDGVLGWSPKELGFCGLEKHLRDYSFNMVGVFLTYDGQIEKVVPQTGMR